MNFIIIVIAVVVGMWVYKFTEDIFYLIKSGRAHKQLLRWKRECEENISKGKDIEENKRHLEIVKKSLNEFVEKGLKRMEEM